jgi:GAF domain-containing protein
MLSQAELLEVFVGATGSLVDDFDLVDFLHTLTDNAARVSGASVVGLVLADHHDRVRYMASNTEEGKILELLHIQNDDGPGLDAITSGHPVVNANLGEATARWPVFAPAARAAGLQSVHAFPMRLRDETIGALNIFGVDRAHFDPDDVRLVQGLADVATIAILQERARHHAESITDQLGLALQSRIVIEQAKGALARSESVSVAEAFGIMVTTARLTGRKLADVAGFVIADLEPPSSGDRGTRTGGTKDPAGEPS